MEEQRLRNMIKIIIKKEEILKEVLKQKLNKSKNNLKTLCENNLIIINNKPIKKLDYKLKIGDKLIIKDKYIKDKNYKKLIEIIYEDNDIIVVNKPFGLLSISDNKKHYSLYNIVSNYIKIKNKNNKIFIIHRLDRDTSGVIMFAKSEKVKNAYQNKFNDLVKKREYIAIVNGILDKSGTIKKNIIEDKTTFMHISNSKNSKIAITHYDPIKHNNKYSMIRVNIDTGRKNQIRVHLSSINHSIIGDIKYGNKNSPIKRLGLHAKKLEIINPKSKKMMTFDSSIPESFYLLFKE